MPSTHTGPVTALARWLNAPDSAINLAVLRIVLFAVLGYEAIALHPVWFASLPRELLWPPAGGAWLTWPALLNPATARAAQVVMVLACVAAVLGVRTRTACLVATLTGLYLLGVPELWGKVNHYMHLLWLAALLSVSPCGDALAWDVRGQPLPERDARYGRPLHYAWIILGLVYFFPGLWKLSLGVGSSAWWAGDNLKWHMYRKWVETGHVIPRFRIDQWPLVYQLGGLATVCFEIGFLPLVCWRRTRVATALAGVGFHVGCAITMLIWFWILPVLYVMFIDWEGWARRWGWAPRTAAVVHRRSHLLPLVATSLLLTVSIAGLTGTESWPVAAYPTFAFRPAQERATIDLRLVRDGTEASLSPRTAAVLRDRLGSARWVGMLDRIGRVQDDNVRRRVASGVVKLLGRTDSAVASADSMRLYRTTVALDPTRWSESHPVQRLLTVPVHSNVSQLKRTQSSATR